MVTGGARLLEPATRLPREKPLPRPWRLTRCQQFMRLKGISPKKKTNLLWEEASGQWLRRWGYKLAWDDTKEWVIEVPGSSNPIEDQFAKRTQAKKERVAKNELNRLRNLVRAHKLQMPSSAGLHPTGHQSAGAEGRALAPYSAQGNGVFNNTSYARILYPPHWLLPAEHP